MKTLQMLTAALVLASFGPARADDQAEAPVQHEGAEQGAGAQAGGESRSQEEHDIGSVMLHHVVDDHVIEYPGFCGGHFQWGCEIDTKKVFGSSLVFGRLDLTPTRHVVMMWIAALLLVVVVLVAVRGRKLVPHGLYNFVEVLVAFVRNEIAIPNMGAENADRFVPYLTTAFFFILFMNLLGLLPWAATPTGNLSVTMMMAGFTFVITQAAAIRQMGLKGFLAHLTGGVGKSLWWLWPVMVPVEILGLFTKPFALTVRLFANMIAGHFVILALLGLIFVISPWVAFGAVPMALGIFLLEIFVALVQAYIFTMLSALFIGAGLESHGEHGEHAHPGPGAGSKHPQQDSHVAGNVPGHG
jgi:F-type H+-transporting ATPase subunit a